MSRRGARLGRPVGTGETVHGVVLLLPGGRPESTRAPYPLVTGAGHWPLARALVRAGREEPLVCHTVRYRYRGWNGSAAHPADDARWAADEVVRRYGDVPLCLVGTDIGGRAALRAADHPAVQSVVAIAPWLPPVPLHGRGAGTSVSAHLGSPRSAAPGEPVNQLRGRQVLLVHGTDDRRCDPELSFRLAVRAREVTPDVCRFEAHTDGHQLRQHRPEVRALVTDFVLGTLCGQDFARPLTDALAAPPPLGLRMPLAAGFGQGRR